MGPRFFSLCAAGALNTQINDIQTIGFVIPKQFLRLLLLPITQVLAEVHWDQEIQLPTLLAMDFSQVCSQKN